MAKVKHYRTNVSGRVPAAVNVEDGQIAINTADEQLLIKNSSGQIVTVQAKISADERNTVEKGADKGLFVPLAVDQETGWPDLRPSFQSNFEMARALSSKITFSRTGTSTYIDDFGVLRTAGPNVPVVEGPGFRLRPAETNTFSPSAYKNPNFFGGGSYSEALGVTAPDSSSGAGLFTESAETGGHYFDFYTGSVADAETFTMFLKETGRTKISLAILSNTSGTKCRATFDLSAVTAAASVGSARIKPLAGGWYRCDVYGTAAGGSGWYSRVQLLGPGGESSYAGDGVSGVHFWGIIRNAGDPIPYISTTSGAVTRPADNASIQGAALGEVWNASEGAVIYDVSIESWPTPAGDYDYVTKQPLLTPHGYFWLNDAGNGRWKSRYGPELLLSYFLGRHKIGLAWDGMSTTVFLDGSKVGDALAVAPLGNLISIAGATQSKNIASEARQLSIFNRRPSDAQMEAMTS